MTRFVRKYGAAGAALLASVAAQAQTVTPVTTYATPQDALQAVGASVDGFGPTLFGMAVLSSAIMLGIAWIKKSRGAGK